MFSEGIERDEWHEMAQLAIYVIITYFSSFFGYKKNVTEK